MSRGKNNSRGLSKRFIMQMLFASADVFTFEGLQRKLVDLTKDHGNPSIREAGRLTLDDIVGLCQELQQDLAPLGLQLLHSAGSVRLATSPVDVPAMREWLASYHKTCSQELSEEAMATLVYICRYQPVTLKEVNEFFAVDRTELVSRLVRMGLISRQHGKDGVMTCTVTDAFLRKFNLAGPEELGKLMEPQTEKAHSKFTISI